MFASFLSLLIVLDNHDRYYHLRAAESVFSIVTGYVHGSIPGASYHAFAH
jgi:hypothetical protein